MPFVPENNMPAQKLQINGAGSNDFKFEFSTFSGSNSVEPDQTTIIPDAAKQEEHRDDHRQLGDDEGGPRGHRALHDILALKPLFSAGRFKLVPPTPSGPRLTGTVLSRSLLPLEFCL